MTMNSTYEITEKLLDKNIYSRPGSKMKGKRGVCIHWVANPLSTATGNRNYFNNLKNQGPEVHKKRYASSHEIIGLDGEVVVCVPKDEVAFHAGAKSYRAKVHELLSGSPNRYLYGIEVCHPDWYGKFSPVTYKTVIQRVAHLLIEFGLAPSKDTLWRHYDVTGKDCPRYYVKNPKAWDQLINDITYEYNQKMEVEQVSELIDWQKEMGEKSIEYLEKEGLLNNPEKWSQTLGENVPQWLFWSLLERMDRRLK
jgi:N-acetylmuramoyl-L-alanine amidase